MAEFRMSPAGPVLSYGGDTFNTAVYATRVLQGAVTFLTRIGMDPLSGELLRFASNEGLPEEGFIRDPDRNLGIYSVTTDDTGERSFHYWRSMSAARQLFANNNDLDRIDGFEIVYLSGITLAILSPAARSALRTRLGDFRAGGGKVAFDSNYRPRLWEDRATAQSETMALWKLTDIALPSLDDEMALFGGGEAETIARLHGAGCVAGAVKRGVEGPLSLSRAEVGPFPPAKNVVDTTAAGDSFNAAYLAACLQGKPEPERLAAGHALASRVIARPGAIVAGTA